MMYLFRLTLKPSRSKKIISEHVFLINLDHAVMTLPFGAHIIFATWCGIRTWWRSTREAQGIDLGGSGTAKLAVAAGRRRRTARELRWARAAPGKRDRGRNEEDERPYPTGVSPRCLGDSRGRQGDGAAAARDARQWRAAAVRVWRERGTTATWEKP
jgi:hypothetical protein